MALLLLHGPSALPTQVALALDGAGYTWKTAETAEMAGQMVPAEGWSGVVIASDDHENSIRLSKQLRGANSPSSIPWVLLASDEPFRSALAHDLFDDFVLTPLRDGELVARIERLAWRANGGRNPEVVEFGALSLNLDTYQASVSGRALDMTYMEYELLKHFALRPGRVFSREELLRNVWGYEYYGGARTVDVHVRRLRAKLGEEHANLIQTVRSVGYMFGVTSWSE